MTDSKTPHLDAVLAELAELHCGDGSLSEQGPRINLAIMERDRLRKAPHAGMWDAKPPSAPGWHWCWIVGSVPVARHVRIVSTMQGDSAQMWHGGQWRLCLSVKNAKWWSAPIAVPPTEDGRS